MTRLAALAAFLLTLTACGGDAETAKAKDYAACMTKLADKIESIQDKAGAEAAKGELMELATKASGLLKQFPDPAKQSPTLREKVGAILKAPNERIRKVIMNAVKKPEVMVVLQGVFEKLTMAK